MKILVINNYDSFVYNLTHLLKELGCEITIAYNDKISLNEVNDFSKILLSPGPGLPKDSGKLLEIIRTFAPYKSIFGVCLGQQAIAEAFGGNLIRLEKPLHGESSVVKIIKNDPIFNGLPNEFSVGRYHSWIVQTPLPNSLESTSLDEQGHIMSLRHKQYDLRAVQYHPESILTPNGKKIIENWLMI